MKQTSLLQLTTLWIFTVSMNRVKGISCHCHCQTRCHNIGRRAFFPSSAPSRPVLATSRFPSCPPCRPPPASPGRTSWKTPCPWASGSRAPTRARAIRWARANASRRRGPTRSGPTWCSGAATSGCAGPASGRRAQELPSRETHDEASVDDGFSSP